MIAQPNIFDMAFEAGKSAFSFAGPLADDAIDVLASAKNIIVHRARNKAIQKIVDAIKHNEEEIREAEIMATGPHQKAWMDMLRQISNGNWQR